MACMLHRSERPHLHHRGGGVQRMLLESSRLQRRAMCDNLSDNLLYIIMPCMAVSLELGPDLDSTKCLLATELARSLTPVSP